MVLGVRPVSVKDAAVVDDTFTPLRKTSYPATGESGSVDAVHANDALVLVSVPAASPAGIDGGVVSGTVLLMTMPCCADAVSPRASDAVAVNVWLPFAIAVVVTLALHGAEVADAITVPSIAKSTRVVPAPEVAENAVVPLTVAPADGAERPGVAR